MPRLRERASQPVVLLWLYAALTIAIFVVMILPGEPFDQLPVRRWLGWAAVAGLLVFFIARRSRVAWTIALAINVFWFLVVVLAASLPIAPFFVVFALLQAASMAVLLSPALRAYVRSGARSSSP